VPDRACVLIYDYVHPGGETLHRRVLKRIDEASRLEEGAASLLRVWDVVVGQSLFAVPSKGFY